MIRIPTIADETFGTSLLGGARPAAPNTPFQRFQVDPNAFGAIQGGQLKDLAQAVKSLEAALGGRGGAASSGGPGTAATPDDKKTQVLAAQKVRHDTVAAVRAATELEGAVGGVMDTLQADPFGAGDVMATLQQTFDTHFDRQVKRLNPEAGALFRTVALPTFNRAMTNGLGLQAFSTAEQGREALFARNRQLAERAANDPLNIDHYVQQLEANIDAGIATGFLKDSPDARQALIGQSARKILEKMVDRNPAGAIDILDGGHLHGLTDAELAPYREAALRQLDRRQAETAQRTARFRVAGNAQVANVALQRTGGPGEILECEVFGACTGDVGEMARRGITKVPAVTAPPPQTDQRADRPLPFIINDSDVQAFDLDSPAPGPASEEVAENAVTVENGAPTTRGGGSGSESTTVPPDNIPPNLTPLQNHQLAADDAPSTLRPNEIQDDRLPYIHAPDGRRISVFDPSLAPTPMVEFVSETDLTRFPGDVRTLLESQANIDSTRFQSTPFLRNGLIESPPSAEKFDKFATFLGILGGLAGLATAPLSLHMAVGMTISGVGIASLISGEIADNIQAEKDSLHDALGIWRGLLNENVSVVIEDDNGSRFQIRRTASGGFTAVSENETGEVISLDTFSAYTEGLSSGTQNDFFEFLNEAEWVDEQQVVHDGGDGELIISLSRFSEAFAAMNKFSLFAAEKYVAALSDTLDASRDIVQLASQPVKESMLWGLSEAAREFQETLIENPMLNANYSQAVNSLNLNIEGARRITSQRIEANIGFFEASDNE